MTPGTALVLAATCFAAGAVNSVAGGGSLLSFPAAMAVGLSPLVANATNAVAMTPASLASTWAYRHELREVRAQLRVLAVPSFLGGAVGSLLLLWTPQRIFDALVPLLILFATMLLLTQNLRSKAEVEGEPVVMRATSPAVALQFAVAVYGGYFGAGIGIMMLALLGHLRVGGIHRMNALKTLLAALINGVATAAFLVARAVDGRALLVMTVGATAGGFAGAAVARRVDPRWVRWGVVCIGVSLTAVLAYRRLR